MEKVILAKNIDWSQITYGNMKSLESGGRNVYMSVAGKPIIMQTPRMLCQWGLSKYNPDGKTEKFSIDLSFKGMDAKPGVKAFFDKLVELDTKVVEDVTKNCKEWLRKANMTQEVVEALSTPNIKHAKDKDTGEITDKYPPSFRLNVPTRDGKVICDAFDAKRNKIDMFNVETKGANVTGIIKLQGLWFAGGKFGCTWRIEQVRIEPPDTIKGFAFQPDEEDALAAESDGEDDVVVDCNGNEDGNKVETSDDDDDATPVPPAPTVPVVVDDSDDEDAIEKPKVVKNVARKKKASS